jgi:hypothetical protein
MIYLIMQNREKTATSALTRAIRISKIRGSLNNTQVQVQGNEKNIST